MWDEDREPPTGTVDRLVEIIGEGPTLRLLEAFGGTRVYLPERWRDEHRLVQVIGHEALERLVGALGSGALELPAAVRSRALSQAEATRREVLARTARGESEREIALACRVTQRWVREIRRQARVGDETQRSLF